jgi:hypothetical protein
MIIGGHALLGMDEHSVQLSDTILETGDGLSPPWGRCEAGALVIRLDLAAVPTGGAEHAPSWPPPGSAGRASRRHPPRGET